MSYHNTPDDGAEHDSVDIGFFQVDETPSAAALAATPARRQRLALHSLALGGVLVLCAFAGKAVFESGSTVPSMTLDADQADTSQASPDASVHHHPFVQCKTVDGLCQRYTNGKVCASDDDDDDTNAFNICGDYTVADPSSSCYLDCAELIYMCTYKKDELCPTAPSAAPTILSTENPTCSPKGLRYLKDGDDDSEGGDGCSDDKSDDKSKDDDGKSDDKSKDDDVKSDDKSDDKSKDDDDKSDDKSKGDDDGAEPTPAPTVMASAEKTLYPTVKGSTEPTCYSKSDDGGKRKLKDSKDDDSNDDADCYDQDDDPLGNDDKGDKDDDPLGNDDKGDKDDDSKSDDGKSSHKKHKAGVKKEKKESKEKKEKKMEP